MSELKGDMRPAVVRLIPEMCKFFLSNKRYCYHIMRSNVNDYLKQLINYFYFDKQDSTRKPPTIPKQIPQNNFDNLSNFPDIEKVFDTITIKSFSELVIPTNSKKDVLFIFDSNNKITQEIPRIIQQDKYYYVLVSFMITSASTSAITSAITSANKQTIESVSIPESDTSEYISVTVTNGSQIKLNYQKMLFPPAITKGQILPKVQSKSTDYTYKMGGNKTIRKYRKHNRNKTTRNYK